MSAADGTKLLEFLLRVRARGGLRPHSSWIAQSVHTSHTSHQRTHYAELVRINTGTCFSLVFDSFSERFPKTTLMFKMDGVGYYPAFPEYVQ